MRKLQGAALQPFSLYSHLDCAGAVPLVWHACEGPVGHLHMRSVGSTML